MPSLNDARKSIQDKFTTEWADETISDFDNTDFKPPPNEPWVRLVVRNKDRKQSTLGRVGNRKFLSEAEIAAQVFVPVETGTSEADRLSTKLRDIFEGTRLDGLWFFSSVIRESGTSGDFHQYNVECSFSYEDIK